MNCGKCGKVLSEEQERDVMNGLPCFCPDCLRVVILDRIQERDRSVRRDLIDYKISRICDDYCRFPKLIESQECLLEICECCPIEDIRQYLEGVKNE